MKDWHQFHTRALKNLNPGGYLEQVETSVVAKSDDGSTDHTHMEQAGNLALEAAAKFGKSLKTVDEMEGNMVKAGFVDVKTHYFKLPIGSWPKDKYLKTLGQYQRLVCEESIEMWVMRLWTSVLGVCVD